MHDADLGAHNSKDAPNRVAPQPLANVLCKGGTVTMQLPPASWTVVRLKE